jgi:hypothetical protein
MRIINGKLSAALALLAMCAVLLAGTQARATEGGGGAYPNGAEDFMSGAVPPPGTYFINYFDYYSAGHFKDKNGKNAPFPFNVDVYANVFRLIHVTDIKILGGFWGMHIFLPLAKVDVHKSPGGSGNNAGLGDIIIDPLILSWHGKNWHVATGLDIYCPTGNYDKYRVANTGRNYWTFEPIVAGTYVTDGGFEVSAKFLYDFNTRNPDTDYLSGQEFHVDYTVGQKIGNLSLGAGGYYYQQTTSDDTDGPVNYGKGMTIAVGPQAKYDHKNMSFVLKYYFELESYNRPQGNNLWAKFIYAF